MVAVRSHATQSQRPGARGRTDKEARLLVDGHDCQDLGPALWPRAEQEEAVRTKAQGSLGRSEYNEFCAKTS